MVLELQTYFKCRCGLHKDQTWACCKAIWIFPQVIILIGNKADLEAQRDVTYEEAKQFAEENGKVLEYMRYFI